MNTSLNDIDLQAFGEMIEMQGLSHRSKMRIMDSDERLVDYLNKCNQQGVRSSKRFPTLTRLADFCSCYPSTINRIASGDTLNPSRRTISLLNVFAGICPYVALNDDYYDELNYRIKDANKWMAATSPSDNADLMTSLKRGISTRANRRARARRAKRSQVA
ncbi:hypothetical protein Poly51_18630 [Rubripirellula tenax]|uniref:Uncharacterized protein n=1 Tax=Rubripirellula tenax TaxID=2528015 RepID=A0A5C6FED8_9BACT|nr:hypothetical protein [Rubripirellula tenax]TWU59077.1 hypothetical protein Poly51_18630 [Rubripirellula tenax]